ncbi:MAG: DUF1015 domain-containing protein [Saccharofermentanales bacterium]|jgi:hypothetical protein
MSDMFNEQAATDNSRLAAGIGVAIPEIYLPCQGTDLFRWAVVACDQFTSQPEYWQNVASIVGSAPSTRRLILPELFLDHPGDLPVTDRIREINRSMLQYLSDGTLASVGSGWIVIDRETGRHTSRKGLLLAVDLDRYAFEPGNRQPIRATEETVLDRLPPRLEIRREAPLELPHVQLLIDDPAKTVIEPLFDALAAFSPIYDTLLMLEGGRVRGWMIPEDSPFIRQGLLAMADLDSLHRYGLLFAVGDGNHSLATAKAHWQQMRDQVPADHPARFALVELINIHDAGLDFQPIHRVVFDLDPAVFLARAKKFFAGQDLVVSQGRQDLHRPDKHGFSLLWQEQTWSLAIRKPKRGLSAGSLQDFLDHLVPEENCRIDYIHGTDVIQDLARQGHLGLLLPSIEKSSFFATIARGDILPRKTFSMGEAEEKRYYMECRKIC